ncbi:lantibiotic dehydratase [Microbispora sp. SCL1-1]|uniref:lantibiotic dehydratase n=1 Tax=Microbispora TaxID=2005 RepID=UPI00115AEFAA|nr:MULTISPECIES: lantibiotic dehydratase [unclassified Microbispora]NJP29333.1 lantibiotic dehydratase [Microbispora sp. CL1-1]TQS05415.1 lantibiotic dehydratase [Microbispora sp. SCL1-1]
MYEYLDAVVVRAAVWSAHRTPRSWPELSGKAAEPDSWRQWLRETMRMPGFLAALEQASPVLTHRVCEICEGRDVSEPAMRRAVLSVMRYLLRASGRATPFGLFAGVAPARIATLPTTHIGSGHRAVTRVDATWLASVIERLEAEPALRPHLKVMANNLVFERDGQLVLEHRPAGATRDQPTHVSVRATAPIRTAMSLSQSPIRLGELAEKLAADFPGVPAAVIDRLLADLAAQRLLVTSLRPPMTAADPLGHLLSELEETAGVELAGVAETVGRLRRIAQEFAQHDDAPTSAIARSRRARLAADMAAISPVTGSALAVDLRVDLDLAVPESVAAEAAKAAGVLVRLARRSDLGAGWVAWHGRFLERYGPRALVPVLDAVDPDIGLGYPAGYLGAPSPPSAALSERDVKLLALAQKAALRGQREILLDETTVADLEVAGSEAPNQPTTELTIRVHAPSVRSLSEGAFTLAIIGVSRTTGTTTGRFLHLFDDEAGARMSALYAELPTAVRGALRAQISSPALHIETENVARAPRVATHLLPMGEYHDGGEGLIALEDLALTADIHRLYLVSRCQRRPVEPFVLNAVEPVKRTHPLVRFLTEVTNALSVPCVSFDWGAAAGLPFLPALRYGRTILSPARWLLTTADLHGGQEWEAALAVWRDEVGLPQRVYLGDGDQRLGLDLCEPAHRSLLRAQLGRTGTAVLRATPGTDAAGWIGGHVHEIVVPLVSARKPARTPEWLGRAEVVTRNHGHLPGCEGHLYLKLYGHPDRQSRILIHHLPRLLEELGDRAQWWFLRYQDPEEHLRLRLTVPADRFALVGEWTRTLRRAGLIARVQWDTDFPETARFGGQAALAEAETYFAADSAAALAQLTASAERGGPDVRALTAASMFDIVTAMIGDTAKSLRWLIEHATAEPSAPPRALYDQALALANPYDHRDLDAQPGGVQLVSCWSRRRQALAAYRRALEETGTSPTAVLLPELLHLHHVRMAGTSLKDERVCLHLARAAALSWTARSRRGS